VNIAKGSLEDQTGRLVFAHTKSAERGCNTRSGHRQGSSEEGQALRSPRSPAFLHLSRSNNHQKAGQPVSQAATAEHCSRRRRFLLGQRGTPRTGLESSERGVGWKATSVADQRTKGNCVHPARWRWARSLGSTIGLVHDQRIRPPPIPTSVRSEIYRRVSPMRGQAVVGGLRKPVARPCAHSRRPYLRARAEAAFQSYSTAISSTIQRPDRLSRSA
jgi:hypothetical protein